MRTRFLAAVSTDERALRLVRDQLKRLPSFRIVFERGPLLLFASGDQVRPLDLHGVVIGTVFAKNRKAYSAPGALKFSSILGSETCELIEDFWGGYVALGVSPDEDEVGILRAPLGDLPCYFWRSNGLLLAGSDLEALSAAGMPRPSLNVPALAKHIVAEDLRRPETCLEGIEELQGGERIATNGNRIERRPLWSPWDFLACNGETLDPANAAALLRRTAIHAVASQAARFPRILLKLSGGLDSSIVAACLARSNAHFTALNLVTRHPAGDERDHARTVATRLNAAIVERYREPSFIDLGRSAAARLPRPTARAFTQESQRIASEVAAEINAEAVFDGGGGDNVFCSLQSARPLADCLIDPGGRSRAGETARTIARLSDVSLWTVIGRALAIVTRRSWAYRWNADSRFLSSDGAALAGSAQCHAWLDSPRSALPGKAAHVALIAAAQSVVEGFDAEDTLPTFSPLICQPLIEACLKVPSWLWFDGGLNRAMARRAFAGDLPEATLKRRSKGAPDCFIAEIYEADRARIRLMLLEGVLSREKLIDRDRIEAALDDRAPVTGHDWLRIMHLVDAEAWARCWT